MQSSPHRPLFATLLLGLLLIGRPEAARAQINIESLRRDDAPAGLSGSVGGDLNVTTGNVDFVSINVNTRLTRVTGSLTELLIGQGGVGFLGRNRFATSGLVHYRQTYRLTDWIGPEWYVQTDYDRALLLDFRALVGSGARLDFARGTWGRLGAGVSFMLEHERLSLPEAAVHPSSTTVIRNSTFVSLRVVPGEHLVINSTTYVQPALGALASDLRVLENLRIATDLTEQLALTISFDVRYDSDPPDGISALDTRTRMGVTFSY